MLTIKEKKTILKILKKGKIYETNYFRIYYSKTDCVEAGFVVTVPKKLAKAVRRNYIKRIIKNLLRHKKIDYDLIIRPKLSDINFNKAKEDLENFWRLFT